MPHIHTKPGQHDHTASAFIVRLDQPGPALMLHRHKKLHTYLQFGGHIELNENPWQTIAHELLEESGYKLNDLKVLQPKHSLRSLHDVILHPEPVCHMTHTFLNEAHFHTDVEYAFTAIGPPKRPPLEGESTDIRTFTKTELKALTSQDIFNSTREICLFILSVVLKEWEEVNTDQFKL